MLRTGIIPKNICILRLSALGDVTHAVPVVRAIQKSWPDTKITWVCGKQEHKLLTGLDDVRFVALDKKAGWRGYRDLGRKLRGERFDILLHMQVSARANLAAAFIRADVRLGWDKARSRDLHQLFIGHRVPAVKQQHQVQGHLSFARALGLDADEPIWDLPVTTESKAFAEKHLPGEKRTLLISPSSSHPYRNWSAQRYAQLADYAIEQLAMRVALIGGPGQQQRAIGTEIEKAMANKALNLIGKDTLQDLLALLQRGDVLLSPDSGPAHIANALGTPVIGLHASTWSIRTGPYNFLHLCVDKFPEAAEKFRHKKPEDLRWGARIEEPHVMDLIQTDEVIDRLLQAVKQKLPEHLKH